MPSPCSAADLNQCSAALRLRGTPCEPAWYLQREARGGEQRRRCRGWERHKARQNDRVYRLDAFWSSFKPCYLGISTPSHRQSASSPVVRRAKACSAAHRSSWRG